MGYGGGEYGEVGHGAVSSVCEYEMLGGGEVKYNEMAIKLVEDLTTKDRSADKGFPIEWSVLWLDNVRQREMVDSNMYIQGEIKVNDKPKYLNISWPVWMLRKCWGSLIDRTIDGANWCLIGVEEEDA
jgi:hypothetical protein